jgi:transposase
MQKSHIHLSASEHQYLAGLLAKGSLSARLFKRATALLALHQGQTLGSVCQLLQLSYPTVMALGDKYQAEGLACLQDKPRSGRPIVIDGEQRAKITALACSTPPTGYARWSLRLLADKAVELSYCAQLSYVQAGEILKKTKSSLT